MAKLSKDALKLLMKHKGKVALTASGIALALELERHHKRVQKKRARMNYCGDMSEAVRPTYHDIPKSIKIGRALNQPISGTLADIAKWGKTEVAILQSLSPEVKEIVNRTYGTDRRRLLLQLAEERGLPIPKVVALHDVAMYASPQSMARHRKIRHAMRKQRVLGKAAKATPSAVGRGLLKVSKRRVPVGAVAGLALGTSLIASRMRDRQPQYYAKPELGASTELTKDQLAQLDKQFIKRIQTAEQQTPPRARPVSPQKKIYPGPIPQRNKTIRVSQDRLGGPLQGDNPRTIKARVIGTGKQLGGVGKSVGKRSAALGLTFLGFWAANKLADRFNKTNPRVPLPRIRSDIEFATSHYSLASEEVLVHYANPQVRRGLKMLADQMKNVKGVPTQLLTEMQTKIRTALKSTKEAAARHALSFYLGVIAAELLGRGVGHKKVVQEVRQFGLNDRAIQYATQRFRGPLAKRRHLPQRRFTPPKPGIGSRLLRGAGRAAKGTAKAPWSALKGVGSVMGHPAVFGGLMLAQVASAAMPPKQPKTPRPPDPTELYRRLNYDRRNVTMDVLRRISARHIATKRPIKPGAIARWQVMADKRPQVVPPVPTAPKKIRNIDEATLKQIGARHLATKKPINASALDRWKRMRKARERAAINKATGPQGNFPKRKPLPEGTKLQPQPGKHSRTGKTLRITGRPDFAGSEFREVGPRVLAMRKKRQDRARRIQRVKNISKVGAVLGGPAAVAGSVGFVGGVDHQRDKIAEANKWPWE